MFESLDTIDWSSLDGCYQPATEIPFFLRSLLSPVYEIRCWALAEIAASVFHQGSVFTASPVVVPFLYELLEDDDFQEKEELVHLVAAMALCRPDYDEEKGREPWMDEDTFPAAAARDKAIVTQTKLEIGRRFDLIYPYLRKGDESTRAVVAEALEGFPKIAARVKPDLENALNTETDEGVRSAIERALARIDNA